MPNGVGSTNLGDQSRVQSPLCLSECSAEQLIAYKDDKHSTVQNKTIHSFVRRVQNEFVAVGRPLTPADMGSLLTNSPKCLDLLEDGLDNGELVFDKTILKSVSQVQNNPGDTQVKQVADAKVSDSVKLMELFASAIDKLGALDNLKKLDKLDSIEAKLDKLDIISAKLDDNAEVLRGLVEYANNVPVENNVDDQTPVGAPYNDQASLNCHGGIPNQGNGSQGQPLAPSENRDVSDVTNPLLHRMVSGIINERQGHHDPALDAKYDRLEASESHRGSGSTGGRNRDKPASAAINERPVCNPQVPGPSNLYQPYTNNSSVPTYYPRGADRSSGYQGGHSAMPPMMQGDVRADLRNDVGPHWGARPHVSFSGYDDHDRRRFGVSNPDQAGLRPPNRKMPHFDGKGEFRTFLCIFGEIKTFYRWSDEVAAGMFRDCLSGYAADFYAYLPDNIRSNYTLLTSRFQTHFGMGVPVDLLREQLYEIQQVIDEPTVDFARRVGELACKAYPDNPEKSNRKGVLAFLKGSKYKEIACQILMNPPDTIEGAVMAVSKLAQIHRSVYGKERKVRSVSPYDSSKLLGFKSRQDPTVNANTGFDDYLRRDVRVLQNEQNHFKDKLDLILNALSDAVQKPEARQSSSANKVEKALGKNRASSPTGSDSSPGRSSRGRGRARDWSRSDKFNRYGSDRSNSKSSSERSKSPSERFSGDKPLKPARKMGGACHFCGEYTHWIADCPNKTPVGENPKQVQFHDSYRVNDSDKR